MRPSCCHDVVYSYGCTSRQLNPANWCPYYLRVWLIHCQSSPVQNLYICVQTKTNRKHKSNPTETKVYIKFSISYTNVRGLRSSFQKIEYHLQGVKHGLMFLPETDPSLSIPVQEFTVPCYSPLMAKHESWNRHGLDAYIKDSDSKDVFPVHVLSCGPLL